MRINSSNKSRLLKLICFCICMTVFYIEAISSQKLEKYSVLKVTSVSGDEILKILDCKMPVIINRNVFPNDDCGNRGWIFCVRFIPSDNMGIDQTEFKCMIQQNWESNYQAYCQKPDGLPLFQQIYRLRMKYPNSEIADISTVRLKLFSVCRNHYL